MIAALLLVFIICLIFRFPIAFSLGLACLVYLLLADIPLIVLPMKMYAGIDVFVLLSVPGFILAGKSHESRRTDRKKSSPFAIICWGISVEAWHWQILVLPCSLPESPVQQYPIRQALAL